MVSRTPAMQTSMSCSCSHNISDIFSKKSLVGVNSDRIWWLWSCQKDASSPRKHLNCSTLNFLLQVDALALCKAKTAAHVSICGTTSKFISCRHWDLNQILSDKNQHHHHMLPAHVLKYHALRLGHLFTSQSQKKTTPKIGWTKLMDKSEKIRKIKKLKTKKNQPTQDFRSKNPIQNRPSNINPCRCRCPNLQKSASERNRSFSSSDVDLPGQRDFLPKKLQDLWPDKIVWRSLEGCFWGGNGLWM